jgi:dihydrodipicolinate synthase/N-acetylneuraminate lyase
MQSSISRLSPERQLLVRRLFPSNIPTLWCPALVHFADDGAIDDGRMQAHLSYMLPAVKGFLIPGSTGEGWEMADETVSKLLGIMIDQLVKTEARLLIGILKTDTSEACQSILATVDWLKKKTGARDTLECLQNSSVCGFTVCPPSGIDLDQARITKALEGVLSLEVPVALYQLPQVTQNEMSPQTVSALSARFPNFYLLKDTSGRDRIAKSEFDDALLVRGAEGDYAKQLRAAGGGYDGFLLSTANCFGARLSTMIEDIENENVEAAESFSRSLTMLWAEVFQLAGNLGYGNSFTNANKAMDHYFAYGPGAASVQPPLLHSGKRLTKKLILAVGDSLKRFGLMPTGGYL